MIGQSAVSTQNYSNLLRSAGPHPHHQSETRRSFPNCYVQVLMVHERFSIALDEFSCGLLALGCLRFELNWTSEHKARK